jgi:hypothetical protein
MVLVTSQGGKLNHLNPSLHLNQALLACPIVSWHVMYQFFETSPSQASFSYVSPAHVPALPSLIVFCRYRVGKPSYCDPETRRGDRIAKHSLWHLESSSLAPKVPL